MAKNKRMTNKIKKSTKRKVKKRVITKKQKQYARNRIKTRSTKRQKKYRGGASKLTKIKLSDTTDYDDAIKEHHTGNVTKDANGKITKIEFCVNLQKTDSTIIMPSNSKCQGNQIESGLLDIVFKLVKKHGIIFILEKISSLNINFEIVDVIILKTDLLYTSGHFFCDYQPYVVFYNGCWSLDEKQLKFTGEKSTQIRNTTKIEYYILDQQNDEKTEYNTLLLDSISKKCGEFYENAKNAKKAAIINELKLKHLPPQILHTLYGFDFSHAKELFN